MHATVYQRDLCASDSLAQLRLVTQCKANEENKTVSINYTKTLEQTNKEEEKSWSRRCSPAASSFRSKGCRRWR